MERRVLPAERDAVASSCPGPIGIDPLPTPEPSTPGQPTAQTERKPQEAVSREPEGQDALVGTRAAPLCSYPIEPRRKDVCDRASSEPRIEEAA